MFSWTETLRIRIHGRNPCSEKHFSRFFWGFFLHRCPSLVATSLTPARMASLNSGRWKRRDVMPGAWPHICIRHGPTFVHPALRNPFPSEWFGGDRVNEEGSVYDFSEWFLHWRQFFNVLVSADTGDWAMYRHVHNTTELISINVWPLWYPVYACTSMTRVTGRFLLARALEAGK